MAAIGAFSVPFAIAVALTASRFGLRYPSLVDDWIAYDTSPADVLHAFAAFVGDGSRFRPSWDVWFKVIWLGYDDDGSVGQSIWNLLRIALLVAGLVALTWLLLELEAPRLARRARAVVSAIPATALVLVPWMGVDLARLGPQEPALIGGLALGATLLVRGTRWWQASSALSSSRLGPAATIVAGLLVWAYGAYHKEASVCALVAVPLVLLAARRSRACDRAAVVVTGLACAPLVHVLVAASTRVADDNVPYEATSGLGAGSLVSRSLHMLGPWRDLERTLLIAAVVALAVLLVGWARCIATGGPPPLITSGLAVVALASHVFTAQSGVGATRYAMPALALLFVVVAVGVSGLGLGAVALGLVPLAIWVTLVLGDTTGQIDNWVAEEKADDELVAAIAERRPRSCDVLFVGRWGAETTYAVPAVLARRPEPEGGQCETTAFVPNVDADTLRPPDEVCPVGWQQLPKIGRAAVWACGRVDLSPSSVAYLRAHRIEPGGSAPPAFGS